MNTNAGTKLFFTVSAPSTRDINNKDTKNNPTIIKVYFEKNASLKLLILF